MCAAGISGLGFVLKSTTLFYGMSLLVFLMLDRANTDSEESSMNFLILFLIFILLHAV